MCTRLFKNANVRRRLFMLLDTDHPYQLTIRLVRQTPKQESDVDFAVIPGAGLGPVFTSKTSFIKEKTYRYKTEEEASNIIRMINEGTYCFKCGDPSNCTKRIFKDWSKISTFTE